MLCLLLLLLIESLLNSYSVRVVTEITDDILSLSIDSAVLLTESLFDSGRVGVIAEIINDVLCLSIDFCP